MNRSRSRINDEEQQPLLGSRPRDDDDLIIVDYDNVDGDAHKQFCLLIGIPPSDLPPNQKPPPSSENKLYARAKAKRRSQNMIYQFTASLSNILLLSQVVLGATLTALGASSSSHVLITLFGVANTVIAGVVAYLKSRGQPMRARMYLDDLEHVVGEIENSEIMWLGISRGAHGYDEIDVEDAVSVRSEVARLTRLFNKAVDDNTKNNPDLYQAGGGGHDLTSLRARPPGGQLPDAIGANNADAPPGGGGAPPPAPPPPPPPGRAPAPPPPAPPPDPEDESPATKKDKKTADESKGPNSPSTLKKEKAGASKPDPFGGAGSAANATKKPDLDKESPATAKAPPGADAGNKQKGDGAGSK